MQPQACLPHPMPLAFEPSLIKVDMKGDGLLTMLLQMTSDTQCRQETNAPGQTSLPNLA